MTQWFMQYGGLVVVLFLAGLIPQVVKNDRSGIYQSGSRSGWIIFCPGYFLFALYEFFIGEILVGWLQFISGMLCVVIIIQSFMLRREGEEKREESVRGKIFAAFSAASAKLDDPSRNLIERREYIMVALLKGALMLKEGEDAAEVIMEIKEDLELD